MIIIVEFKDENFAIHKLTKLNEAMQIKKINFENFNDLLNEILQFDLFNDYKCFFISQCDWFETNKKFTDNLDSIKKLIKSTEMFNIYFLVTKIFDEQQITKILTNINFLKIPTLTTASKRKYINESLIENNLKLSNEVIEYLTLNTPNDFLIINNEIKKISAYCLSNINNDDLFNLISNYQQANIFKLTDYILLNDYQNALKTYQLLINHNEDEIMIMNVLIINFINVYYILYYGLIHKMNSNQIANITNINHFQVLNIIKQFANLNYFSKTKKILDNLYNIDYQIKINNIKKKNFLYSHLLNWLNWNN